MGMNEYGFPSEIERRSQGNLCNPSIKVPGTFKYPSRASFRVLLTKHAMGYLVTPPPPAPPPLRLPSSSRNMTNF